MKRWSFGRVLALFLTVILVTWIVLTVIFGMVARSRIPEALQQYNQLFQRYGVPFHLSVQPQRTGLFTSTYDLVIQSQKYKDEKTVIPLLLEHGPVLGLLSASPITFGAGNVRISELIKTDLWPATSSFNTEMEVVLQQAFPFSGGRPQIDISVFQSQFYQRAFYQENHVDSRVHTIKSNFGGASASLNFADGLLFTVNVPSVSYETQDSRSELSFNIQEDSIVQENKTTEHGAILELKDVSFLLKIDFHSEGQVDEMLFTAKVGKGQYFNTAWQTPLFQSMRNFGVNYLVSASKANLGKAGILLDVNSENVQISLPKSGLELLNTGFTSHLQISGAAINFIMDRPVNMTIRTVECGRVPYDSFFQLTSLENKPITLEENLILTSPHKVGQLELKLATEFPNRESDTFELSYLLDNMFALDETIVNRMELEYQIPKDYILHNLQWSGIPVLPNSPMAQKYAAQAQLALEEFLKVFPVFNKSEKLFGSKVRFLATDSGSQLFVNNQALVTTNQEGYTDPFIVATATTDLDDEQKNSLANKFAFNTERLDRLYSTDAVQWLTDIGFKARCDLLEPIP